MTAHEIIIRPIVSERSYALMEENKYTFEVARNANKYQIKDAVEELFSVHVTRVNTINVKPKTKRVRYIAGKTRQWKKAVVTLAEGESIEIFGAQAYRFGACLASHTGRRAKGCIGHKHRAARYRGYPVSPHPEVKASNPCLRRRADRD